MLLVPFTLSGNVGFQLFNEGVPLRFFKRRIEIRQTKQPPVQTPARIDGLAQRDNAFLPVATPYMDPDI